MNQPTQPDSEFTALWVKAQPTVSSYIFSAIRDTHRAEDLLQDVAGAAVAEFAEYDRDRPFLNWVLGIARFRILNYYRSERRDRLVFDQDTLVALADAHESIESSEGERRHALRECLKKTHERGRRTLTMRYVENLSVKSIADRMETTPNAISLLLYKVRAALAKCIEERLTRREIQQ